MNSVRLCDLDFDPFGPHPEARMPTPAQLRELEAAVCESLTKLEDEASWEALDDLLPDEYASFLVLA